MIILYTLSLVGDWNITLKEYLENVIGTRTPTKENSAIRESVTQLLFSQSAKDFY